MWDREQAFNLYLKPFTSHFRFRSFDIDLKRNPLLVGDGGDWAD